MYLSKIFAVSALLFGTATAFKPGKVHAMGCHGESPNLYCYDGKDDTPQNVDPEDVAYVAKQLREYGRETNEGRFLTMTAKDAPDCAEWTIFTYHTVLVLAKHVFTGIDSSVLFEDIAKTIDGGSQVSDDMHKGILGCSGSGGARSVLVNQGNPSYHSEEYRKAGYSPDGILIKVVANRAHFDL
ncbi:hypothetical protein CDD82_2675 [Ophiocordyceps australis]|uniref:Ecp2 effector protein domain-containing protein n=1 Tax=Ophiocordyceps australis TaxID=1399860 RepID=A0A2C5ZMK6_9HYPO|nr:hypothetical protein CDD82_2675 [Ophiocordyceps australis]